MAVTSDHIWYPAGGDSPAYDLRKAVMWSSPDGTAVDVRFQGMPASVRFASLSAFETAKQTSLDAGG